MKHRVKNKASAPAVDLSPDHWALNSVALAAGFAACLAVLLYTDSVRFGYVYDDVVIAQSDVRLQDPGYYARVWGEPWWSTSDSIGESRPLTSLTFWAQMQLHGDNPWPAHAANIVLMGVLTSLVAVLAASWVGRPWVAWPVGLVFATHPIHVEAVVNLVGRAELMSAVFAVCSLLGWLRWRTDMTWPRAAGIALCIWLAGQSKETGYLVAAIILFGEIAERRCAKKPINSQPWLVPLCVCVTVVAIYALTQRSIVLSRITEVYGHRTDNIDPILNPLVLASVSERLVTPLQLTGKAAQLLAFPVNQAPDYSPRDLVPSANPLEPMALIGLGVIVAWALAVRHSWKTRSRALGPLLGCLVAWAIPSNSILLIGVILGERLLLFVSVLLPIALVALYVEWSTDAARADRRQRCLSWIVLALTVVYLAIMLFYVQLAAAFTFDDYLIGKCLGYVLITIIAATIGMRITKLYRTILATGAVVLAFGLTTLLYAPYWQSWSTLVLTTSIRHPQNAKFQGELSLLLLEQSIRLEQNHYPEAETTAQRAIELWPLQPTPYVTLACLAKQRGDDSRARELMKMVSQRTPDLSKFAFVLSHFGLDPRPR